jgi:hypothetical protein
MTPPGEQLEFTEAPQFSRELKGLEKQERYLNLYQAIDAAIRYAGPGQIERLWHKRDRNGLRSSGCSLALEYLDPAGVQRLFTVLYIERGMKRHLVLLNEGLFDQVSLNDFCSRNDGIPFKRS